MMCSFNDYNGVPVAMNHYLLTDLLRKSWGFKGYVVSDSWENDYLCKNFRVASSEEEAVAKELNAGMNVRTYFATPEKYLSAVRKAVEKGFITEEFIDQRVREILYVKFWLGLFDNPYCKESKKIDAQINSDAHRKLSLRAARESIVLLKNKNHLLPLSKEQIKKIAVIGPNADEVKSLTSRYGSVHPHVITGLQGIKDYVQGDCEVVYAKGCNVRDRHFPESDIMYFEMSAKEKKEIDKAVALVKESDVAIVYVGDDSHTIGESRTRVSLNLSGRQEELIRALHATGKPIVMVMFNGRPQTINWAAEHIDAIVEAWYPGEFSGQVVAEVLFGETNPGGKLSVTFPKSVGQIPWAFPFKPHARAKGFARVSGELYPFGYGLSYTDFKIDGLEVVQEKIKDGDELIVRCKVQNVGQRTGDEVVQLYLSDDVSSIGRYEKELCGFERITLEPNQTKEIEFKVNRRSYGFYNQDNQFVVEPGSFTLHVGNSSENTLLKSKFYVE